MISTRPRILIEATFLKHFALEVWVSIVCISCSLQFISERELSVSFEKGGNWVCSSFTVMIEAK